MGMVAAFSKGDSELDGDLASIFRQRLSNPQAEWDTSPSPQSPFHFSDRTAEAEGISDAFNLQGKSPELQQQHYNLPGSHSSSLRAPDPAPPGSSELMRAISAQKLDQDAMFGSLAQRAGIQSYTSLQEFRQHVQEQESQHQIVPSLPQMPHTAPHERQSSTCWSTTTHNAHIAISGDVNKPVVSDPNPSQVLRDRFMFGPRLMPTLVRDFSQPLNNNNNPPMQLWNREDGESMQQQHGGNWPVSNLTQAELMPTFPQVIRAADTESSVVTNFNSVGLEQQPQHRHQQRQQALDSTGTSGLQLVHLLLACAEAVENEQLNLAQVILVRLNTLLVPRGNTMQRLAAVFIEALTARITNSAHRGQFYGLCNNSHVAILELLESFSVVYDYTPLGKFPHLTLNQILLDAVEGASNVHVVDIKMHWRGMQWPAFIQALALRPGGPPRLRLSAIAGMEDLEHSKEKLQEYARNLGVPFEFCAILEKSPYTIEDIEVRYGETVCINSCAHFHTLLTLGEERFHQLLCELRSLNPRVLVLAENDGDHNCDSFLQRFVECLKYYSAVFDALDASVPPGSSALFAVEQLFSGQKIRNIIACEGSARVERHERMASWNRRFLSAGFRSSPLSSRAISQARLLLSLYFHCGYTLSSDHYSIVLGWKNMPLLGAAAWKSS